MSPVQNSRFRRLAMLTITVVTAATTLVAAPAFAVDGATEVTFTGGGWGHGIGMPQYAARGMAEDGSSHAEILAYFYTGTELADIASTNGSGIPEKIRVGNVFVAGTEERPFLWLDFHAVNGSVEICLPGEAPGGCSFTMSPGETWRVAWVDGAEQCQIRRNGSTVHSSASCGFRLEWSDQPNTRVSVPEVGRVFARGAIEFVGPVTYNQQGFHFVVELTMQEYLYGLAEMPVSWHQQALEAQVIAARSFAADSTRRRLFFYAWNEGLRPDCSCHLVWSTFDQAYRGWHTLNEGNATHGADWKAAVDATDGTVVAVAGTPEMAETYYYSSSGGATENAWDVWGSDPVKYFYLASVPDTWSQRYVGETSTIRWSKTMTAGQVAAALGFQEIYSMDIADRYASGSPSRIDVFGRVGGSDTTQSYTGGQIKTALGLTSHHIYTIEGFAAPERLAGTDRYATAVTVSQHTHPSGADTVYLAVGTNFPDALAAGPAATAEGAPILLTRSDSLPGPTFYELKRLDPQNVVVLGGEAAISPAVVQAVRDAVPGADVARRAGSNRYGTAAAISSAVFPSGVETVYVATGEGFPDALIATPAAAAGDSPIVLVQPSSIPGAAHAELQRLSPDRIVVVGGTASVSNAVFQQLQGYAGVVERISAPNRHSLSVAMSQEAFPTADTVYIAVDDRFPDALSAGPLTATDLGPLLLVGTHYVETVVRTELSRLGPSRIVILGGPAAVSEAVAEVLATFIR